MMSALDAALAAAARDAARDMLAARTGETSESFREFFARTSPGFQFPEHLTELTDAIERIDAGECVELVVSVPPRHGKTETVMHGIAWLLKRNPKREVVFGSYAMDLAVEKSRIVRGYCRAAGVQLADDANNVSRWKTTAGGGFLAGGVGGGQTGFGGDINIIDDPYKGFVDANSSAHRRAVDDWFSGSIYTRRSPGASTIIVQTRWHPDDLAGKRERAGWRTLRKPAIDNEGNALWPERFPVEELRKIQTEIGAYTWAALYQGTPRLRGDTVFTNVSTYDALPSFGARYTIGVDLAYTAKTSADYSVALIMAHAAGVSYVVDVIRQQASATAFVAQLKALKARFPSAAWRAYVGGTEKGIVDFLAREGLGIGALPAGARGDKLVRAQPVAAAWNAGKVLVPSSGAAWLEPMLGECMSFTGVADEHDDIVDALAAAFDAGRDGSASLVGSGSPRDTRDLRLPTGTGPRGLKW